MAVEFVNCTHVNVGMFASFVSLHTKKFRSAELFPMMLCRTRPRDQVSFSPPARGREECGF